MFSDIGIKPSIIRSSRGDDPNFLNTAWTLQVIRECGLWIGCCLIAWPVSRFYDNQELLWLIPTVGLTTIISGFNSTSLVNFYGSINNMIYLLLDLKLFFWEINILEICEL